MAAEMLPFSTSPKMLSTTSGSRRHVSRRRKMIRSMTVATAMMDVSSSGHMIGPPFLNSCTMLPLSDRNRAGHCAADTWGSLGEPAQESTPETGRAFSARPGMGRLMVGNLRADDRLGIHRRFVGEHLVIFRRAPQIIQIRVLHGRVVIRVVRIVIEADLQVAHARLRLVKQRVGAG